MDFDLSDDGTIVEKYIYLSNYIFDTDNILSVVDNIDDWYYNNNEVVADLSDVSPYNMVRQYLEEYGGDSLEGKDQVEIKICVELEYERGEILEAAKELEKEVVEKYS